MALTKKNAEIVARKAKASALASARLTIREEFRAWMKEEKLSYQGLTDKINEAAGLTLAKYPTVVSWGVRGHVPRSTLATALKAACPACPLLNHVEDGR